MTRGARSKRYHAYRAEVRRWTEQNKGHLVRRPGYTLDHIVPVSYGFNHGVPAHLIGGRENLVMVPYQDNIGKGAMLGPEGKALLAEWEMLTGEGS